MEVVALTYNEMRAKVSELKLEVADTKKETYDLLDSLTSHLIKIGGSTNA